MLTQGDAPQKDVKKNERSRYVYENKRKMDKVPDQKTDIYVEMTRFLQKKWFCDRQNAQEFAGEYDFGSLDGVPRRKSVHQFSPDASGRHNVSPRREPIPKRSLAFNGKIEKLGTSDDVAESTGSYWFSGRNVRKSRPFECNGLRDFKGGWSPKKKGGPQKCRDIRRYV
jgi:hypothetical protein